MEFVVLSFGYLKNKLMNMSQRIFVPNKLKYKKLQKQLYRLTGKVSNSYKTEKESFILKSIDSCRIYPEQLESVRRVLRRNLGRQGELTSHVVCDLPLTTKSSGIRMGKGKGSVDKWCLSSPQGRLLFSLLGTNFFSTVFALKKSTKKFSGKKLGFFSYNSNLRFLKNVIR